MGSGHLSASENGGTPRPAPPPGPLRCAYLRGLRGRGWRERGAAAAGAHRGRQGGREGGGERRREE